jgi:hypothetical protein
MSIFSAKNVQPSTVIETPAWEILDQLGDAILEQLAEIRSLPLAPAPGFIFIPHIPDEGPKGPTSEFISLRVQALRETGR